MRPRSAAAAPAPAAAAALAAAALLTLAACTHTSPHTQPATITVEEQVDLPVGTTVHLCLRHQPCQTHHVSRQHNPQIVALPLPPGVSLRNADGWQLTAYATSHGVTYRDTTDVQYRVAVDPPCQCTGDYAYVELPPARQSPNNGTTFTHDQPGH